MWTETGKQLSYDGTLIPRPWGQEGEFEDKSDFSLHMSAASMRFVLAFVFIIQRPFIYIEGDDPFTHRVEV